MSQRSRLPLAISFSLLAVSGCVEASDSDDDSGLVGAWIIVETTTTTPDSTWVDESPQPGLYMFTDRHFSLMLIPEDAPRPLLPEDATPEQRLAVFENFVADAGSYVASDSILTMQNVIAKLPRAMNSNAGSPYRYRINGDSLTLSFSGAWATGGEITYRLVRLN